jgi:hypothetical protein
MQLLFHSQDSVEAKMDCNQLIPLIQVTVRCPSVQIVYKLWYAMLFKWHTKIFRQSGRTDSELQHRSSAGVSTWIVPQPNIGGRFLVFVSMYITPHEILMCFADNDRSVEGNLEEERRLNLYLKTLVLRKLCAAICTPKRDFGICISFFKLILCLLLTWEFEKHN